MIEQEIPLWGWCITGKTFEKEENNNKFTPWNSSIVGRSHAVLAFEKPKYIHLYQNLFHYLSA